LLDDLCELMTDGSLCALGGLIPLPVQSAVRHFPEDFAKPASTAVLDPEILKSNHETHPWR
jgi:formate dehydrogenase iron-sulfur subunit